MRIAALVTAAALALGATACGGSSGEVATELSSSPAPAVDKATVHGTDDLKFSPKTVRVKVGGSVEWVNDGSVPHTVTFEGFDKQLSAHGRVQTTFDAAGTVEYVCTLHPIMKGTVIVE